MLHHFFIITKNVVDHFIGAFTQRDQLREQIRRVLDAQLRVLNELVDAVLVAFEVGENRQILFHRLLVAVKEGLMEFLCYLFFQLRVLFLNQVFGLVEPLFISNIYQSKNSIK